MIGRRGGLAAAAIGTALAVAAGCTGADGRSGSGTASNRAAPSGAAQAVVGPCPRLDKAKPVPDGLPPLRLPCLGTGPAVRLSDLRGTPTVVNVWAAWCTTCDREMPLFADAVARYGDRVRFFGVHYKAAREAGLASERDFGVPFPSVHDEDGDRVVRELDAYAPPQTFFVDGSGRITGRQVGEISSAAELRALIAEHLGVGR